MAFMHRSKRGGISAIAIAVVALMVAPVTLMAQDTSPAPAGGSAPVLDVTEPVVVVSIGSINKVMQDVGYMSSVMGNEQAGMMFSMAAGGFTQGIDPTQPIAIIVPLVNQVPQPIALLPTADVKTVLKRLEGQTGPAEELDDGTLVIAVGSSTVFIRQLGNWAVLARERDLLDLAPADPTTVFNGMGNDFDLAVRLRLQKVPAETRSLLIAQIRQGFEQAMAQQNDADAESAREMAETQMDQLEMMLDQTDEIVFGINVDQSGKLVAIEGSMTAVPGSEMASIYGGQRPIPSRFASVIRDDAAAYYHASTSIAPAAVKQTRAALDGYLKAMDNALAGEDSLSSEQKADLASMLKRIADLAMASIEEGKADVGALLLADSNDFRFVFGSFVADGNEAANIVKELADKVKSEPNAPRFKFDQSNYKGIAMHLVEADVPADQDEARRVFGDTLRVHVGTGEKVVFVAVGNDSEGLMKQLIDAGASDNVGDRPVGQMKISLLPILQYAHSIESNDTIAAMIDALSRSPDLGELVVVSQSIENGGKSRLTIGEGLLQAIGAAIRENQPAPAGQF